ncbi:hypothetical protein [Tenacibaculum discolor]|uniref:Co-chaperone DjlA N-terminal domain-containing protein n=1 Tax=Tenacibaculum discolor TaxID=361581 RepID=A0A2G1BSZ8_9FLAO|nr:hypothetical protein [Tenacibaculum discolor]MDP2542436.1 hypothetical protein [Tenacibaculum discolor]PHN97180.1 hypothetical protein CSC81_12290 [Tenacibaculum discolor]RLK06773.1 hypothetical protein C8N27_0334 [Tenacibaculum discolor]
MKFTEEFYKSIANLFYAVSMADKNMTVEEKKSIVKRVEKNWSTSENKSDSELIYETLRELIKEKVTSETAYESFKEYYLAHKEEFSKNVIHDLLAASHEISSSYARKNKSELIILARLYKLFNLV